MLSCVFILIFSFRTKPTVRKGNLDENNFSHNCAIFFQRPILKVTRSQPRSEFFLDSCEVHWRRNLRDTLQLKILRNGSAYIPIDHGLTYHGSHTCKIYVQQNYYLVNNKRVFKIFLKAVNKTLAVIEALLKFSLKRKRV